MSSSRKNKSRAGNTQPNPPSSPPPENIFSMTSPPASFVGQIQQTPMYSPGFQQYPGGFQQYQTGFQQYQATFPGGYPGGFQQFHQPGPETQYQATFPGGYPGGFQQFHPRDEPLESSSDDPVSDTHPETQDSFGTQIPETQPETQVRGKGKAKGKGKRKATEKVSTRAKPTSWTTDDEVALASAYVHISEDSRYGNNQSGGQFWNAVVANFNERQAPNIRKKDSIYSKWKEMNRKMTKFNGIYNRLKSQYKSGWTEAEYFSNASTLYRDASKNISFTNEAAWRIVKDHPKWLRVLLMTDDNPRPTKRSNTSDSNPNTCSSDARCRFDLNNPENAEDDDEIPFQEPERPTGRDKAKRAEAEARKGKGKEKVSSQSEGMAQVLDYVDRFELTNEQLLADRRAARQEKMELQRQKLEMFKKREERKQMDRLIEDMKIYNSPHDHLHGPELVAFLEVKEKIGRLRGWN